MYEIGETPVALGILKTRQLVLFHGTPIDYGRRGEVRYNSAEPARAALIQFFTLVRASR